jgi:GTPase
LANIVAIVGRPNVGKSTLFNRLIEQRKAIMDNESGVTRDRHYGSVEWNGKTFSVIDTGGYVVGSDDVFEGAIREQVELALDEAEIIVFLVDGVEGLTGMDKDFANVVRRSKKPIIVAVNKIDTPDKSYMTAEFYGIGFEEVYPVSAQTGHGTGELLDEIVARFPEGDIEVSTLPRFAIVGRPNVGKSSFLNALLNENRSIVTDIAGTTRDPIDSHYKLYGKEFIITDTAGLRKKAKIKHHIEFYSVMRALRIIENSDVCIVLLDATKGIESQDVNIIHLAARYGKGLVVMVNKWDLVEKDTKTADGYMQMIRQRLEPNDFAPIIFTSALTKQRIFQAIEKAVMVYENRIRMIPTSVLNDKLLPEVEKYPPPASRGRHIKIKYITQIPSKNNPTFLFFCNYPNDIGVSYERFLENKMREYFDLEGVPIRIYFREK